MTDTRYCLYCWHRKKIRKPMRYNKSLKDYECFNCGYYENKNDTNKKSIRTRQI